MPFVVKHISSLRQSKLPISSMHHERETFTSNES